MFVCVGGLFFLTVLQGNPTSVHAARKGFVVVKVDVTVHVSPARVGIEGVGQDAARPVERRVVFHTAVYAGAVGEHDIGLAAGPGELEAEAGDVAPGCEGVVHVPEGLGLVHVGRIGGGGIVYEPT